MSTTKVLYDMTAFQSNFFIFMVNYQHWRFKWNSFSMYWLEIMNFYISRILSTLFLNRPVIFFLAYITSTSLTYKIENFNSLLLLLSWKNTTKKNQIYGRKRSRLKIWRYIRQKIKSLKALLDVTQIKRL